MMSNIVAADDATMFLIEQIQRLDLLYINSYLFDNEHNSLIFEKRIPTGNTLKTCVVVDMDFRQIKSTDANSAASIFNYDKYCQMQNNLSFQYDRLYRFNFTKDMTAKALCADISEWIDKKPSDIEVTDNAGSFSSAHIDNTPIESVFEKIFAETYSDSIQYLKKEYSISLAGGRTGYLDYVLETKHGNFAIEENGISYHHPSLISQTAYKRQLEKQNTAELYGFKVYRFSSSGLLCRKEQIMDEMKMFFGNSGDFVNPVQLFAKRKTKLFEPQEKILWEIKKERLAGNFTSLIILPTGSGKSQIVIEDLKDLISKKQVKTILIMVPSVRTRADWQKRIMENFGHYMPYYLSDCTELQKKSGKANKGVIFDIKTYNSTYLEKNSRPKEHYDYIVFDEAHHAQAANCRKTLSYYTPKYLIGLTATPDRLDGKKLEEIFGGYETNLTLREAVEKNVVTNIRCFRLKSNIDLSQVRYNGKDYSSADLERKLIVDSRNELIASTVRKYFSPQPGKFWQGIIFCVNLRHCTKIEKLLNDNGISARALYGGGKDNDRIVADYKAHKLQFLVSCQVISEGWDCPQTEVIVMARPTLSKVLYLQQIGRGVRKYEGKECLYVVDVVDNYDGRLIPWSFNSLFHISQYSDFAGVTNNDKDYLSILGLSEQEIAMQEVDILSFEEKYGDYKSLEETARELYIGTATLHKWIKKEPKLSSLGLPVGNRLLPYFSESDIENIRKEKELKIHNDSTILHDFNSFIDENDLTFSFKLVFMISMLQLADSEGEVNMDKLIDRYSGFYIDRIKHNLPVDRKNCIYTAEFLKDRIKVKKSILENPFEKFERKRFLYFSKDLNIISFNPILWQQLTAETREQIVAKETRFLEEYYQKI